MNIVIKIFSFLDSPKVFALKIKKPKSINLEFDKVPIFLRRRWIIIVLR